MSEDIKTVQITHGEAMEALWRRGQALKRLQQENEKLRAALKPFAEAAERNLGPDDARIVGDCTLGDLRAAAEALGEGGDE